MVRSGERAGRVRSRGLEPPASGAHVPNGPLQQAPRRGSVALTLDALETWGNLARMSGNDFESAVFGRYPAIREGFEALAGTHPTTCRLSGSGSTLFGLYRSERVRDEASSTLGRKHGTLTPVWTMAKPPPGPHQLPDTASP